jgi:sensor histidine kinase YesM
MGNYDSALFYLKPFEKTVHNNNNFGKINLGFLYDDLKEYDKALQLIKPFTIFLTNQNRFLVPAANSLMITAKALLGEKKYKDALQDAREAQIHLNKIDGRVMMIANYKLLSDIFSKLNIHDSAYYYLSLHTTLKDSLLNRQFFWRLSSFKKEAEEERKTSQINLLNKDNQIKEQKLKQESFAKKGLIIGILLLFLLGIFIFRNLSLKRKNDTLRLQKDLEMQQLASEKKQAELHQKAVELEMQALRAQMNPHFIFNCLSSINRFIFKNDNKLASDYLTRFSRLIRMVLMHSSKKLIPLEDELEMLRLYLDLERLRFKDAFDYSITTTNIVDAGAIFIPPLLLQPFCENAVWHGLMHKESKGHLNVIISEVISENEKVLQCVIEDDGVGREKAAEMKSKSAESEKSLGLKITTERLALLNQEKNFSTFYKIEDLLNENNEVAGTRVQLKIRHKESVEEYA